MKQNTLKPYKFHRIFKTTLWGGDSIAPFKGIVSSQPRVGESWEISGLEGHESVVNGGDDDGLTLSQLIDRHRERLVGADAYARHGNRFPLLIKLLDAQQDLSLQVHPDDSLAQERHGCNGKAEMWYVLDHKPGARILSGLSQVSSPSDYKQRVADGTILDIVASHPSHVGDVFYIPAGRIHTLGAGNLVAEVQQTCDITYRVYDYDRRDASGQPRQLHVQEASDAIDYTVHPDYVRHTPHDNRPDTPLAHCEYFDVHRRLVDGVDTLEVGPGFLIIMCLRGQFVITDNNGNETPMHRGETILVPACIDTLHLSGQAAFLTITL